LKGLTSARASLALAFKTVATIVFMAVPPHFRAIYLTIDSFQRDVVPTMKGFLRNSKPSPRCSPPVVAGKHLAHKPLHFLNILVPTTVLTCVGPSHGGQPSPRHQLRRQRVGGIQIPKSALEIQTGMALHAQILNSKYRGKTQPNMDLSDRVVRDDPVSSEAYPGGDRSNILPFCGRTYFLECRCLRQSRQRWMGPPWGNSVLMFTGSLRRDF
jgi:hypothetical protein